VPRVASLRRCTEAVRRLALVLTVVALGGCGAERAAPSTPTSESPVSVPAGVLAAVPFQNRLDVAQGIFQLKLYNGTEESLDVVGVQLVWDGMTTEVGARENQLAAHGRLDFPVALAPAACVGDGDVADMPDPQKAVAKVHLRDGSVRDAPVFDVKHFARALYLEDCSRQLMLRSVDVAWADLHETELDGRPVTEGLLRVQRKAASGDVSVIGVLNTINYTVIAGAADPLAVMAEGDAALDVPVQFLEGRCDVHGLSESSQPFKFVVIIDLGDGVERSLAVVPDSTDQLSMRARSERACEMLGEIEFAGQS
jgi:hypothetical protein